jgi:HD-like signal output (HDOD) protein
VTTYIDQVQVVQLLLQLSDLKHLGNIALLELANTAQIIELEKGEMLSAEQQLKQHVYLLSGEIELSATGKNLQRIVAGSERAFLPLFRVHTHGLMAKCKTPVQLLSLDEDIVDRYVASIRPKESDGIQVKEFAAEEQDVSIIEEIRQVFHHNEVDLPSLPEIALRINRAVNDPALNLRKLATEIQTDPMIAARVIQVANSAMYNSLRRVDGIQDAVSRIGLKVLQAIVMSVVLRNLFKPKSQLVHKRALKFYTHSIRVAAISSILARHLPGFNPEHAFLAGLLHDVGTVPILILAEERKDLSTNPSLLEAVIQNLTGMAGAALLRQWGFSEDLQMVAKEAQEWQRQHETADYCDLIQVAQLHCHLVGGHKLEAPDLSDLPASRRLQLEKLDPLAVIHEARDEIHDIVNALMH